MLLTLALLLSPPVYDRAAAASIEILVDDRLTGSGLIATPEGLAFTACHVVLDTRRRIEVRSPTGRMPVRVVARDFGHDVAVLRLPRRAAPYPHLELARSDPEPGEGISLFGAPMYRHQVLLKGYVARKGTTFEYLGDEAYYVRVVHLGAPSPPGTSGGPWLNAEAKVVGLQSGLMHSGGSAVGIAFMAPRKALMTLLATQKDARTPTVGVAFEELWEQDRDFVQLFPPRTEGLVVARLRRQGPGSKAGLRALDVIVGIDGKKIALRDEGLSHIRSRRPGQTVRLRVLRPKAKPVTIPVVLEALESLP